MDGIFLIDKPAGITSHKVVTIIREKFKVKKVGHAGTLDPLATGLLIVMLGKATKLSDSLISQNKVYSVVMKLFIETDTGDMMGKIIKIEKARILEKKQIQQVMNSFNNHTYWQQVPIYSAVKLQGKKMYEYARKGVKIESPYRPVTIKKIKLLGYDNEKNLINLEVECSKGTYIRSLVMDIAREINTIATVENLRRISSGNFHIQQSTKLEEIKKDNLINIC